MGWILTHTISLRDTLSFKLSNLQVRHYTRWASFEYETAPLHSGLGCVCVHACSSADAIWTCCEGKRRVNVFDFGFRATIQAIAAYLDAFQKIADAATNTRGASLAPGTLVSSHVYEGIPAPSVRNDALPLFWAQLPYSPISHDSLF
uniref:IMD domain-containing protein n=1 Tax=Timema cristinae TaxID=61476 RepID=A0A7R9CIS9_TIMCR|nr:unnamed protein product [Timema cristinae]